MSKQKSKFKSAVEASPEIQNCFQNGLQALGSYSTKIQVEDTSKICGSVDLDACVAGSYPTQNRWDYIICYDEIIYFVEVHSADTSEVSVVLKKLDWLKDWLNQKAPEINKIKHKTLPYFWIQSKGYGIAKNSRQDRLLAQKGLRPISKLKLPID